MNFQFPKQPKILNVLVQNGLQIFDRPYELNLIGIRSSSRVSNKFDDLMHVCYVNEAGTWYQHIYPCTTDPGLYYLNHPINKSGTALLKHGQYLNTYEIGKHRGKYLALVQRKPVTVYRSKNSSTDIDSKTASTQTGLFGINIHHASGNGTTEDVNRWSAGCQVIANINDFKELMSNAETHRKRYGNHFTYTLLDYRTKGYEAEKQVSKYQSEAPANITSAQAKEDETYLDHKKTKHTAGLVILGLSAVLGIGTTVYFLTSKNN